VSENSTQKINEEEKKKKKKTKKKNDKWITFSIFKLQEEVEEEKLLK